MRYLGTAFQVSYWRSNWPPDPISNRQRWDSLSRTRFPGLFGLVEGTLVQSSNMSSAGPGIFIKKKSYIIIAFFVYIYLSSKSLLLVSPLSSTPISVLFVNRLPSLTLFPLSLWKFPSENSLRAISFTSPFDVLHRNCTFQTTAFTECICQLLL